MHHMVVTSKHLVCSSFCFCVLPGPATSEWSVLLHVMELSFLVCRMGNMLMVMLTSQGPCEAQVITVRVVGRFPHLVSHQ